MVAVVVEYTGVRKNGERERDGARGRCITVTLPR